MGFPRLKNAILTLAVTLCAVFVLATIARAQSVFCMETYDEMVAAMIQYEDFDMAMSGYDSDAPGVRIEVHWNSQDGTYAIIANGDPRSPDMTCRISYGSNFDFIDGIEELGDPT